MSKIQTEIQSREKQINPDVVTKDDVIPVCDLSGKRVILINPPWHIRTESIWSRVASCYPSIGLALIAACLEHRGATVSILDLQAEPEQSARLSNLDSPDFVGITATTLLAKSAYDIMTKARTIWPKATIVAGGVHATLNPEEVLRVGHADVVIRGEGEHSMVQLVAGAPVNTIPGVSILNNGAYWEHPDLSEIGYLDALPFPSYHLLPMNRYHPPLGGALREPSMSIFSTRGCPGRCTYCNSSLSKRMRFRSPAHIVAEIELLVSRYGVKEIGFYDDTFAVNSARVQEFCRLLLERDIKITWSCMSRINYADPSTLSIMAKSGCHMICYGVESADETILKTIRKGINLANVRGTVRMTQRVGIRTRLSFMYGNPGETPETMKKTLNFALQMRPDLAQFNITTPYPGTEMFKWADSNGYLRTKDWTQYDLYNVVMRLPTVSNEQIQSFYRQSYKIFYRRPSFVVRQLFYWIRHPINFVRMTIVVFHYVSRILQLNRRSMAIAPGRI